MTWKATFLPLPSIIIVSWQTIIEDQVRPALTREDLFLPTLPSLQPSAAAWHVKWLQNTFNTKLCNMHKMTIFHCIFWPKSAQNRRKSATSNLDFSKMHWGVILRIGECLLDGLRFVLPKYHDQIPQNAKKTCLLAGSYFSPFWSHFLPKKSSLGNKRSTPVLLTKNVFIK